MGREVIVKFGQLKAYTGFVTDEIWKKGGQPQDTAIPFNTPRLLFGGFI
jgi:hypothetical protein